MNLRGYLVQRVALARGWGVPWRLESRADYGAGPARLPVRLFLDRGRAEADRAARERAAWQRLGPFDLVENPEMDPLSTLDTLDLLVRLEALGLELPDEEWPDWKGWWATVGPTLTQAQRDAVWDLFDRVRLYEVVEIDLEQ